MSEKMPVGDTEDSASIHPLEEPRRPTSLRYADLVFDAVRTRLSAMNEDLKTQEQTTQDTLF